MSVITSIDTETRLIRPAQMAPDLVCLTVQTISVPPRIYGRDEAREVLKSLIAGGSEFVGHNVAYDFAVICAAYPELTDSVIQAYDSDRVTDTMLRQKLLDIRAGQYRGYVDDKKVWHARGYGLEECARRYAGRALKKTGFRLFYGLFAGVPIERWDEHARVIQARAVAYRDGAPDAEFDAARAIIGEKKWRTELDGLVNADPTEARTYALDDATATLEVYRTQQAHKQWLADQYRQARAAFALHLSSVWGLRTDAEGVARLRSETQAAHDELFDELVKARLVRQDGTRDTKRAKRLMFNVCVREGLGLRRTSAHEGDQAKCLDIDGKPLPPGHEACAEHICLDGDACNATEDPTLVAYAELSTLKKVLGNDVEAVERGTHLPIHTRYDLADTGRAISSNPNITNWVRDRKCKRCEGKGKIGVERCVKCDGRGRFAGVRECFVPRPGHVFGQADYPQLELYTLAQCCASWLKQSKLADALNNGLDPHLAVAAHIVGITYDAAKQRLEAGDDEVDRARQVAKVANFGFPGGLGVTKLCHFAKKTYGVELTEAQAKTLKEQWYRAWPEMPHYFARVNALCDTPDGRAVVESLFTKRVRGGASYCAACNNGFQALGSDAAKNACWNITQALYTNLGNPLFGSRLVAFVHDEFIIECPEGDAAHDAVHELARLMCDGANVYLPDVPIKLSRVKPVLMRRWSKKAKQVFREGRLVPWE